MRAGLSVEWKRACRIEPRLAELMTRVPSIMESALNQYDNYWEGWAEIKREFWDLAGMGSKNPELQSSWTYDAVYRALEEVAEQAEDIWRAAKAGAA